MNKNIIIAIFQTVVTKFFLIIIKASSGIVLANFLGPVGKGVVFAFQSITGIITNYSHLSCNESIIYNYSKQNIIKNSLIQINIFFLITISSLAFIVLYLLKLTLPNLFKDLYDFTIYMYLIIPLLIGETFSHFSLRALKKFKLVNILGLITRFNILIFFLIFLYLHNSINTAIKVYTFVSLLNFVISYICLIRLTLPFKFIKLNYREIIYYGLKLHIGASLSESEYKFDIYFVLYFLGASALGIYSVSLSVASLITYLPNSITSVLFPYTSGKDEKLNYQLTSTYLKYLFLTQLLISAFFIYLMKYLITTLYGFEFEESYLIFLFLFPGVFFDNLSRILINFYKSKNILGLVNYSSLLTLILNCILMLLLIPELGLMGAAVSTSISYFVKFVVLFYAYISHTKKLKIKNNFFNLNEFKYFFKSLYKSIYFKKGK